MATVSERVGLTLRAIGVGGWRAGAAWQNAAIGASGRWTAGAGQPPRCRRGRCRNRADCHIRVADLPRLAAPPGVRADDRDRRGAVLRALPRPVSLRAAAGRPRRRVPFAGAAARQLLRAPRGAGSGRPAGVSQWRFACADRPRHRLASGSDAARDPAVRDRCPGRRRDGRADVAHPPGRGSDHPDRAGARDHGADVAHRPPGTQRRGRTGAPARRADGRGRRPAPGRSRADRVRRARRASRANGSDRRPLDGGRGCVRPDRGCRSGIGDVALGLGYVGRTGGRRRRRAVRRDGRPAAGRGRARPARRLRVPHRPANGDPGTVARAARGSSYVRDHRRQSAGDRPDRARRASCGPGRGPAARTEHPLLGRRAVGA